MTLSLDSLKKNTEAVHAQSAVSAMMFSPTEHVKQSDRTYDRKLKPKALTRVLRQADTCGMENTLWVLYMF